MSMILSSKTFNIPVNINDINAWFSSLDIVEDGAVLNMTIEVPNKRSKKNPTLEEMVKLAGEENARAVGLFGNYEFNFIDKIYLWNNKEIYLTANEQLFLFRMFILKDEIHKKQRFYLRNMRKRLGKDFLAELRRS